MSLTELYPGTRNCIVAWRVEEIDSRKDERMHIIKIFFAESSLYKIWTLVLSTLSTQNVHVGFLGKLQVAVSEKAPDFGWESSFLLRVVSNIFFIRILRWLFSGLQ